MKHGIAAILASLLAVATHAQDARLSLADSVRREAGRLAAQGRMEQALALVERHADDLPPAWRAMFAGKLELGGEASTRGYGEVAEQSDASTPREMRAEAVFRLGQSHYAAGRHHLAIPQFRLYLARFPDGTFADEAAYWMAHSSLVFARQRPDRAAYLDTALAYLARLERDRTGYYWPMARAASARVHLARGDSAAAAAALRDARAYAPPEERPAALLLSLQAEPRSAAAAAWEDSLRWNWPLSPEARSLPRPQAEPAPAPTPAKASIPQPATPAAGYALQLGAFSQRENAERLARELAERKVTARVAPLQADGRTLYRVLAGSYPDAETALREGQRTVKPLGYEFRVVRPE